MTSTFTATFQNNISGFHPSAEKIFLANNETCDFEHTIHVLVNNAESGNDIYNIKINCEIPYTFFRDIVFFGSNLVIAVENHVYFFNLENQQQKQFKMDGYFDRFHFAKEALLVSSHTHLSLFTKDGQKKWASDKLAIEKIHVKVINDESISGLGKWSDEVGLIEFDIAMSDGKSVNKEVKRKKRGVFLSLFA